MNYMALEEQYLDILMKIETVIFKLYGEQPELTDYEVDSALESLARTFQGEAKGHPAILPRNEMSMNVYETVKGVCEGERKGIEDRAETDILIRCLKRLRKSISHWTKEGGRQGYLAYISGFLSSPPETEEKE